MPLNTADLDYLRSLVLKRSGIVLGEEKAYLMESRLLPVARVEGMNTTTELVERLRQTQAGKLADAVVDAMTTNETLFFRDVHPFEALKKIVLPETIQARTPERKLHIWCGACSTGQEPYSISMMIREHFPQLGGWEIKILATDLSKEVLGRARRGVFSQLEVNRGLPAPMLIKYFKQSGTTWELKPEIRQMVEFREFNLIEPWPPMPVFDIVFMRNVLIYFDVPTKQKILGGIRQRLRKDGVLFLGGAETTLHVDDAYERVPYEKSSFYRPKAGLPAGAGGAAARAGR